MNDKIVVEIKAVETLVREHIAQLLGYLRACRMEHGLLINFGSSKLQIRKFIMTDYFLKDEQGLKVWETNRVS